MMARLGVREAADLHGGRGERPDRREPRGRRGPWTRVAALAVAATLAGAVLAGCAPTASPTPAASAAPSPEGSRVRVAVCDLLTDPAAAFGRAPISSPSTFSVGPNDRCQWILERDPTRYVGLTLGPASNHQATIDAFGPGEAVPGLGDAALWWAGTKTLSVVTGTRNFQVDLRLDEADATRELALAVAAQVLQSMSIGP
jgi:hypothetical protein